MSNRQQDVGWGLLGLSAAVLLLASTAPLAQNEPAPVVVATVEQGAEASTRRLTGTVNALRDASLSTLLAGVVTTIAVDAGDTVKKGALLLSLDTALVQHELTRARAAVNEGEVLLREAQRLATEAQSLARDRNLARTQADARAADARVAEAALVRIKADAAVIAERLKRHQLRAPFAGVITRRHTDVGEWLDSGTPAFELVALDELVFDVQLPQESLSEAAPGAQVQLVLDALPQSPIAGTVQARIPAADATSRTVLVRIALQALPESVIPGLVRL